MSLKLKPNEKKPGFFILTVEGRLDTLTAPQLDQMIDYLMESDPRSITFDLGGLSYISSAGLRSVLGTYKKLKARDGACGVINLQPQVKKVFDVAKMFPTLNIFASEAEADKYFDAMQRGEIGGADKV